MILKKYNTNPELWKLIHSWLHLLGNKPNAKYCKEEITTHPDYPAITAVTDFLDIGNMEYNAVEADLSYINEFNYPLLAHIQLPGRQFLYPINSILDWKLKNDITKNWSGVVIYPEKNSSWENNHNKSYINKSNKLKISNIILAILIFGILVISLSYQTTLISIYFGILSMFGLFLSVFLLGSELGYQNEILNQVCGDASGSGCQHILRTKYAKGLFGITPADASLLYFFTQFALFLFNPLISSILNSLYLISVIVFPIISVWSIYTQAVKIKKWCLLCLAIIGILFLQFTIVLFTSSFNLIATNSILILLITITLFLILFIRLKQLLKSNNLNLQKLSQYHKWKADAGLFLIQLNKQPSCDIALFDNDILFGNKSAPLRITIACNPYCNPCAKTHKVLDKIVDRFWDKVSIQVRLLCDTQNYEDEVTIATKAILQKVEVLNDSIQIQEMLSDWFEWMDFKKWNVKWEVSNSVDVTNSLLEHENWMDESKISYTPTIFLNGKKIPSQYSIEDIEKMIPELIVYF